MIKRIFFGLMAISICYGCTPIRALRWRQPGLNDSAKFAKSEIPSATAPFRFTRAIGQI